MNLNLNLRDFLKYLQRFKWSIILVPLLCMAIAYFFVRKMPRKYVSEALMSTGITGQFQQTLGEGQSLDYFKLSQQFGNLLEMIKSRKVINMLSYQLILHDLRNPQAPFVDYNKDLEQLTAAQKQTAVAEYEKRLISGAIISTADNGPVKLYDLIAARGYNEQSLMKNLTVVRNGESDFIKIAYISHNPDLSAFVVNNLANDFIAYYTDMTLAGQRKSLAILDTVLRSKQSIMAQKNAEVAGAASSAAARASGAMAAQKEADMATARYTEAEAQRAQVVRTISSIEGAIAEIDAKLRGSGGYLTTDAPKSNSEIVNIDNQLRIANQRYINNNFSARDKVAIDSLQAVKSRLIASSARSAPNNSTAIRQSLIDQKIKLENDLASAKSTMATIDRQLAGLRPGGIGGAVIPDNSAQQGLLRDADLASKEFADVQQRYEQAALASKAGVKLAVAEPGLPGPPEASKNIIYLGLAGASGLMICLLTLFLTFALNNTLNTPEQLEAYTHQKVLGILNFIPEDDKDLRKIWKDNGAVKSYSTYKDLLRSLRIELNDKFTEGKNVLGITSVMPGEGKSFLAGSLTYAFAMMGKNVLLICEDDSSMMDLVSNKKGKSGINQMQEFESFLVKKEIQVEDRITILNRNPSTSSLLELRDNKSLQAGFKILKETFDVIFVDIGSAQDLHNLKEWLMFCDHSLAVYEAGSKMTEAHKKSLAFFDAQKGFLGWVLNKVPFKDNHRLSERG